MIPTGEDWRIRKALGYMPPHKVLQWAQVTICPSINERDIRRIDKDRSKGNRKIGTAPDARPGPYKPDASLMDNGTLATRIDAYITSRSKECGMHPDSFRRALGWR